MSKPTDLVQGTLDLLILKTIALEPMHGWAIAQRIRQMSGEVLQVGQGALYPSLHKLEQNGWISAEWAVSENNRRAKYYTLTKAGRKALEQEAAQWERLVGGDFADCPDGLIGEIAMRWTSIFRLRLRSLFSRKRVEAELDEELRYHLERQMEEGIAAGMTHEDAHYAALQSIKDIEQRKEECRDMRGTRWVEDFTNDLRYGSRQFLKHKGFFAIAAVTLALGIGANTAIFSAVNGVLLRPFPYRNPERLASVWCAEPSNGIPKMECSLPDLREIAARNHSFETVASYYSDDINLTGGMPERVPGVYASANLFSLLGVSPALGRTFTNVRRDFWQQPCRGSQRCALARTFRGQSEAIGSIIRLNGVPYRVIGVMRPDFQFPNESARLWIPLSFAPNDSMATRDNHFINAHCAIETGRQHSSVESRCTGDWTPIGARVQRQCGSESGCIGVFEFCCGRCSPDTADPAGSCGNCSVDRLRECRESALGKSFGSNARAFCESSAGREPGTADSAVVERKCSARQERERCLGLALAGLAGTTDPDIWPRRHPPTSDIQIESPVLIFAAGITLASVVLFGLAPAMGLARVQVSEALREGGRSLTAGSRTSRFRDVLVVIEITLSLVLVIGAGLLLQTLRRLQSVDPGFKPENVLTMSVTLPAAKYPETEPAKAAQFFNELTKRLERVPGVKSAGASTAMPIADWGGWGKYFTHR